MQVREKIRVAVLKYLAPPWRVLANIAARRNFPAISKASVWSIGICKGPSPLALADPPEISNPVLTAANVTDVKADFVADPFMVHEHGAWHMFFEVMNSLRGKGEIGHATSRDALRWTYDRVVLREPFHLSYPFVFKWKSDFYLLPESAEAGELRLYRAKCFPSDWECVAPLVKGAFGDHALFEHDNSWWLLAGAEPSLHNKLRLFCADAPLGPWIEHPKSPVFDNHPRLARPAGRVLFVQGNLVRLAQDCSPTYGRAVNAFIIKTLSRSDYREVPFEGNPVLSPGKAPWHMHGMHHLDAHELRPGDWIACVDGSRRNLTFQIHY